MHRHRCRWTARVGLALLALTVIPAAAPAAQAEPRVIAPRSGEAGGTFSFRTANGILPTWEADDLRLTGVSPGRAITNAQGTSAVVTLPIVSRSGSTNFAAGGFRLTNIRTGDFVNCATPAIDTRARVVDCALRDGRNGQLLRMERITTRQIVRGALSTTLIWSGIALRVADQSAADFLNKELGTNVLSPYVTFATGELTVVRDN
jgi:hypothetical protein